jgi:CRP-like cAMP-binding protein
MEELNDKILNHPLLRPVTTYLERGDFLVRAGERVDAFYIVKTGLVHAFYVSEHDEHTIRFGYEGSIITSIPSFYDGSESELYLQALRKTEVYVILRKQLMEAMEADEELRQWYIASLEGLAKQQMERELDLLTHSPSERLQRVLARSPQLFQQAPLKYIASYLRMTPETLSRIMRK